jgi:cysteine/glycine-rich protein
MNTKKGLYHKKCFSCISCRSQLNYYGAIEGPDDEVYCRVCYLRAFGPGGKNKFGDATPYPVENEESNDACGRCQSKVFEMDKIVTKTGMMHKHCLSCNECKTNLDVSSFHNGFDGEVYCKYCYAVKFGHKQKSQYKGWNDVKAIMGESGDKSACPRCTGMVFEAERMVTRVGNFHRNCFSCIECNKKLDSTTVCEGPDAEVYCQSCYSFEFGTKSRTKPKGKLIKRFVSDRKKTRLYLIENPQFVVR